MTNKPTILFFDRAYATRYIKSDIYNSIFVTLGQKEKQVFLEMGYNVVGCFEEEFDSLNEADYNNDYLLTSFDSDRFLYKYDFKKRRSILGKEITFWRNILKKYNPLFIVNEVITTEFIEVMYIEAKENNIKYYAFMRGILPETFYWLNSPFNSSLNPSILETEPSEKSYDLAKKHIFNVVEMHLKPIYIPIKTNFIRKFIAYSLYYFRQEFIAIRRKNSFNYENYSLQAKNEALSTFNSFFYKYDTITQSNDNSISYIFYPLHFEPEATLSYFSEFYSDQVSTIRSIAHCLGVNQILIVKEHPQQIGKLATKKYRKIREELQNVRFVKGNIDSSELIKLSQAVITLVGIAGFESLLIGKPVVILGDVFYDICTETIKCHDFKELKSILRNQSFKIPDKQKVLKFLAQFIEVQLEGTPILTKDQCLEKINLENFEMQIHKLIESHKSI